MLRPEFKQITIVDDPTVYKWKFPCVTKSTASCTYT